MTQEISAGGIVVRRQHGLWEVLVVSDRNDQPTFPKGKTEKGERLMDTAIREISEEVGIGQLTLIKKLPPVHYVFTRNGTVAKTVHFFVFLHTGDGKVSAQTSEGLHEAVWVPIERASEIIGYPETNKQLLVWTLNSLPT